MQQAMIYSLKDVNGNHFAWAIMRKSPDGDYTVNDVRVLGRTPEEAGEGLEVFLTAAEADTATGA